MNNNVNIIPFIQALTGSITTSQVLAILTSVVGVGMAFFLMWLGVRWITHNFTKAVSTGKLSSISYTAYERPIEPEEPHPERVSKRTKARIQNWYDTHDDFGKPLGYNKKTYRNYLNKRKKRSYYYDSHGNKYYK